MRRIVVLAALAAAFSAWGQAQKPESDEAAKKQGMAKEETVKEASRMVARKPNPKRFEDARHCLERPTNTEIIKCSEEYL